MRRRRQRLAALHLPRACSHTLAEPRTVSCRRFGFAAAALHVLKLGVMRVCVCACFSSLLNKKKREEEEVESTAKSLYLFFFQPLTLSTRSSRGIEFIKSGSPSNASKRYTYSNHFRKHLQSREQGASWCPSHNAPLLYPPIAILFRLGLLPRRHDTSNNAFQTAVVYMCQSFAKDLSSS